MGKERTLPRESQEKGEERDDESPCFPFPSCWGSTHIVKGQWQFGPKILAQL